MSSTRKSSSAPGPALGYSLQYTKMTELLARSAQGGVVEFEGLDDLSLTTKDGHLTLYQTKSALESNPLTNRAVSLWKTLANWADLIESGKVDPSKLKLMLFVSNPVRPGTWADLFDQAFTESAVHAALSNVHSALWGAAPDYPLKADVAEDLAVHVNRFFGDSEATQAAVIRCFGLEVVQESIHADLLAIVRYVEPRRKSDVLQHAYGWTKDRVDKLIAERQPARIDADDFTLEMTAYIRRFNERSILRSFAPAAPSPAETEKLKLRTFVRQLELVAVDYSDQLQAISDFYRAAIDRTKLGESGDVHPSAFDDLDGTLQRSWKNITRQKEIAMKGHTEEERGEMVYRECLEQRHPVENQQPPEHFIPGCYHLLSEDLKVGWHPRYAQLLAPEPAAVPTKSA